MVTFQSSLSKEVYNFTQRFTSLLSKPHRRNLRELIIGMMIAGSSFLTDIGEQTSKGTRPRKNCARYSRALKQMKVRDMQARHIELEAYHFRDEPVLILVDGGDMQKPYAKTMEAVGKVVDGSNGHRPGRGYSTFAGVAYGVESKNEMPLFHHLYSPAEQHFKSEWCEQKSMMDLLTPLTQNTKDRIVVEDRGGDDVKRFAYYTQELQVSFITRVLAGNSSRGIVIDAQDSEYREVTSVQELGADLKAKEGYEKSYKNRKLKKTIISRIAWKAVELPQKKMKGVPLSLVFIYTKSFDQPMAILTDRKVTNAQEAWQIFFWYKKRWEVENFFRAIKQELNAEKFLVRKIEKMKALAMIMMLVMALLKRLMQYLYEVFGMLGLLFGRFCKKWQKKKTHYLSVLDWIREMFQSPSTPFNSYRYRPQKWHWCRLYLNNSQLSLFNLPENW